MPDSTLSEFDATFAHYRLEVEAYLNAHLPDAQTPEFETLHEAMRYATEGGKKIRAVLVLASCETVGGHPESALPAACAVELFHAYSLVHDDLPAMDDDAERRGKPTVHVQYGEANAILVGDALLTLGFEWLAKQQTQYSSPEQVLQVTSTLSQAIGSQGMVGGQFLDLMKSFQSADDLRRMQDLKTGALLSAATEVGAILGGAEASSIEKFSEFGLLLGQTYQLVDDLLDKDQDENHNASMYDYLDEGDIRAQAETLNAAACKCIEPFGDRATWLKSLANNLLLRNN